MYTDLNAANTNSLTIVYKWIKEDGKKNNYKFFHLTFAINTMLTLLNRY